MKPLEKVLRIEGTHIVMDCCHTDQIKDWDLSPVSKLDLSKGDQLAHPAAFPEEITRNNHIFFLNIAVTYELVKIKGFINVTCPTCKSTYRLEKDYIEREYRSLLESE